jgi:TolB protein
VRSVDGGIRNLLVANADGTNQQQVTEGFDINGAPAWSPDGTTVLIQTDIEGFTTLVKVTIGSDNKMSASAQLTADIKADSVAGVWSPDGSKIAFQSKRDGPLSQVFVMNADGSDKRRLSDGNGFAGQPAWSPDSAMVAYVTGEQQTAGALREVYMVAVNEGAPTKVSSIGGSLTNPIWSPDGNSIVCVQPVGDRDYKLLMMNRDGTNLRTLDEGHVIRAPSFSPSGDALIYYSVSNVGNDITLYDFETDRTTSITKNQGDNYSPTWSPDGSMLAWASTLSGSSQHKIVAARGDGSGRIEVSSGDGEDSFPTWGIP